MSKKESNNTIKQLNMNNDEMNKITTNKDIIKEYNFNNPKTLKQDLLFFKDDILKDIRIFENNLRDTLSIQNDEQTDRINLYEKKIESQTQKISYLSNLIAEIKEKTKVEEMLEKFQIQTEQNLSKIDIKINSLQKEMRDGLYKNEKFFTENILYPGIIGYECRFSNFHSFIDYILSNIHQFTVFQELVKSYEFHKIKNKLEKDLKIINLQLKNNFQTNSQFTIEKINESEKKLINLINDYNTKFIDVRFENNKTANMIKKEIEELSNNFGKIIEIKKELNDKYEIHEKKIEEMKTDITNNENKVNEQKKELDNYIKRLNLLTTYIDNNLVQNENNYNNNHEMSRNNRTFKGKRIHSAKEYIDRWLNQKIPDNNINKDNIKNLKKNNKKFFFKGESFIKRYIKGKIDLGEMYLHPKNMANIKKDTGQNKSKTIKIDKQTLSEEKIIKKKINNNQKFFSLTSVKLFKDKKSLNKSNEESKNKYSNYSLSLSKNNINQNSKTNVSFESKKYNNLSLSRNDNKIKGLNMETFDYEKFKSTSYRNKNNSSPFINKIKRSIRIDYVTRIPDIEIKRVDIPDNITKKKMIMTKSLSDGNFNYSRKNKLYFEEKNKALKKRKEYNNFKSPKNFNNHLTFGNKLRKEKYKKKNNFLFSPKKPLILI